MFLVAILAPFVTILAALLFGGIQWLFYRIMIRAGVGDNTEPPFFGILFFRGFLVTLALIACGAFYAKLHTPNNEDDIAWSEEAKQGIREFKYGTKAEQDYTPEASDSATPPPKPVDQTPDQQPTESVDNPDSAQPPASE